MEHRGNDPGDGSGPWLPPEGRPDDNEPIDEPADPPDYGEDDRPPYDGDPYTGPVGPDLGRMPGHGAKLSAEGGAALALLAVTAVTLTAEAFARWRKRRAERTAREAHRELLAGALPGFRAYVAGKRPVTGR